MTLAALSLLFLLNASFIIWFSLVGCKEKARRKKIDALKKSYEEQLEQRRKDKEESAAKLVLEKPLDAIPEESLQAETPKASRRKHGVQVIDNKFKPVE